MRTRLFRQTLLLVMFMPICGVALGQDTISWHVIAAGGGRASDGVLSVEGTIGQAAVGPALIVGEVPANCPTAVRILPGYWHADRTVCLADFNRSGVRDVADIFAFLSAWFAGDLRADATCSGSILVDDIFTFLSQWFAGC